MHIIRITPQLVGWVAERERGGRREGGGKKGGREGREGGREGREGGREGGKEKVREEQLKMKAFYLLFSLKVNHQNKETPA